MDFERADVALVESYAQENQRVSRSRIRAWFDEGRIKKNERALKASDRVGAGDVLEWTEPEVVPWAPKAVDAESVRHLHVAILHEDDDLAIVNKPPGISVHPSASEDARGAQVTLVHILQNQLKTLSSVGGVERAGVVHRIDKWTSGCLVVSKNDWTHERLAKLFERHTLERAYWALCYGEVKRAFSMRTLMGRHPTERKKMTVHVKDGRTATSHFAPVEVYGSPGYATLVEARLETGRTHQIRVHLSEAGHSVMGDPTYGIPSARHPKWLALPLEVRQRIESLGGQALHARTLGFEHPRTGQPIRVEAPLFPKFEELWNTLKR